MMVCVCCDCEHWCTRGSGYLRLHDVCVCVCVCVCACACACACMCVCAGVYNHRKSIQPSEIVGILMRAHCSCSINKIASIGCAAYLIKIIKMEPPIN